MDYRIIQRIENEENEELKKFKGISFEKDIELKKHHDEHYKKYIFYRNLKNTILKDIYKKGKTK